MSSERRPDVPAASGFPHHSDYLRPSETQHREAVSNRPEAFWPVAEQQRAEFLRRVGAANDKLATAGARLPDAFTVYWVRHWADGFWRATQHGPPSVPGVRALIEFGDAIDAAFRLHNRQVVEPSDVEFTYYNRNLMTKRGPSPLSSYGKTLERDKRVSPRKFPRLAAPAPDLAPRIGCEEFLAWAGFLADDAAMTPKQRANLNRVGVDAGGWCVANGGDVTECERIVNNLVVQLRRQTDAVAAERGIDYALTSESCNLHDALRTVKQWLRRLPPPTPPMPADIYAPLRDLAREQSKQLRSVLEALCDQAGELSLGDVKALCQWSDPIESAWNSLRMRLNRELAPLGWGVCTKAGRARLVPPATQKRPKTSAK